MIRLRLIPCLCLGLCLPLALSAKITREVEKSFAVAPGNEIDININGGSIRVEEGGGDTASLTLVQSIRAGSDSEADEILADYEIIFDRRGDEIVLAVKKDGGWFSNWRSPAQFSVRVTCPAYTDLELDTSGGSIRVAGNFTSEIEADTSGGSISIDGGARRLELDTSGGTISVGYANGDVEADTSGGSIRIGYVSPEARRVSADTSGGSISIGLDPRGSYDVDADTSGGSVHISDLPFEAHKKTRTTARGTINGGGTRVSADTSGGGIRIHAADMP